MSNFRFVKNAAVWWPVTIDVPTDGGTVEQQRFELKFKRMTVPESQGLNDLNAIDFLKAVAIDWRGVEDDGKPVPFTPENAVLLLDQQVGLAAAVVNAWTKFWFAEPETRLGNSEPSPAGGPAAAAETADQTASPTA